MRCLVVCVLLLAMSAPACAQHLGDREQWQPQTENDPRLQQRVDIEIIGSAAVTGLPLLSEKTGVSFSVAPEDVATVGEHKFTVISKGLDLKSIMVQLCEALQECHWDVDPSGPQPTYCLHRNSGAEQLIASLERAQPVPEYRLRTLEAVQRALQMTPEELLALEKTNPIIARTLRFAPLRGMVEGLFSLPPDQIEALFREGHIAIDYEDASPRLQEAARLFSRYGSTPIRFDEERPEKRWPQLFRAEMHFDLGYDFDLGSDGISFTPFVASDTEIAFMASCPPPDPGPELTTRRPHWQFLLLSTGTPNCETACQQLEVLRDRRDQERARARTERDKRRRAEIGDPVLLQTIALDDNEDLTFPQLLRAVADKTGLPVFSDCFALSSVSLPEEVKQGGPLWRLLDLIADQCGYQWQKVGQCLVFHHLRWYDMIAREIPERLVLAYRRKLDKQGQFTVEDVAALAAAMARAPEVNVPGDLQRAGLLPSGGIFGFFRVPISSDQLAKARSPEGVSLKDMLPAQRQLLPEILRSCGGYSLTDFQNITLAIRESPYGSEEEGGTEVELELDLWRGPKPPLRSHESFRLPRVEPLPLP